MDVAAILWPKVTVAPPLAHLRSLLQGEVSWLRRIIIAMVLAQGYRSLRRPLSAVRVLASVRRAYEGFRRWLRSRNEPLQHPLLADYEEACKAALAAMEPPIVPRSDPVGANARLARRVRRRTRPLPSRAIAALDALITIRRSTSPRRFDRSVVREIAAMLGARVLLHRRGKEWLYLRPQAEHTLTTPSILRLAQAPRLRVYRVRPRPEFWRPEQRRPGALLCVPIGEGVACFSRRRRFGRKEVAAVRTVLRFLEARLAPPTEASATAGTAGPSLPAPPVRSAIGEGLIGTSPAWRDVLRQVGRVAGSTASVILVGETGTGKERIARALHAASNRSAHEFVAINCGAVPVELVASELFGHIRGAFTGADRAREGLLVRAHRGTLFLDEVADMPASMQVALLRALEEREVRPVGSSRTLPADVRVVCASARDLAAEVAAGRFREDLFHRLDVVRIELPPLRRRREDVPLLAAHLAARAPERATVHPDVLPLLCDYDWPGNVRELDNVIRASAALADGGEITPEVVRGVMAQRRSLRRHAAGSSSARAETILRLLGKKWLSAGEVAARLDISSRTVNRELTDLMTQGLVRSRGEARARRYARAVTPA